MTLLPGRRAERTDRPRRPSARGCGAGPGRRARRGPPRRGAAGPARGSCRAAAGERLRLSGDAHRRRAGRGDRQRQVHAVQRAGRGRVSQSGVRRPTTGVAHAVRLGRRRAPGRCSTGWRSPAGTAAATPAGDLQRAGAARPARPRLDRAGAPAGGRPARRAGRRAGVGARPAEVRRRRGPRPLPAAAGRARRRAGRRPQPGRPARRRPVAGRRWPTCGGCSRTTGWPTCRCCRVSATAGTGLDRLRDVLTGAVAAHRAALRRIAADLDDRRRRPRRTSVGGPARDDVDGGAQRALVAALGAAAGIPAVGAAVQRAAVHRAVAATGLPFTRWLRRLRPDPLRRLHLDRARTTAVTAGPDDADLWRPRTGRRCPRPARWSGRGWSWRCAGSPTTPPRACPIRGRTRCATPPGRARATWPTRWTGPSPPPTSG